MIDNNTGEDGPFGIDRSGSLPVQRLIKLCYSGAYTLKELDRLVFGAGGVSSYLGTKDWIEVERRIDAGDEKAAAVCRGHGLSDRERSWSHGHGFARKNGCRAAHGGNGTLQKNRDAPERVSQLDCAH